MFIDLLVYFFHSINNSYVLLESLSSVFYTFRICVKNLVTCSDV